MYKNKLITFFKKIKNNYYQLPYRHFFSAFREQGISESYLFDSAWYLGMNHDIVDSGIDPFLHYIRHGSFEGRFPSIVFNPGWYASQEGYNGKTEPLLHFLKKGWKLGLNPNPFFNTSWYLEKYPSVKRSGINPFIDYLVEGWRQGREPNHFFNSSEYCNEHPDAASGPVLVHFIKNLMESSRISSQPIPRLRPVSPLYFLKQLIKYPSWKHLTRDYLDLQYYNHKASRFNLGRSALAYYFIGWRKLVNPMPLFSVYWYLRENPSVRSTGIEPLYHYLSIGRYEGRDPHPLFYTKWYIENCCEKGLPEDNGLLSYITEDWKLGLDPNPFFDTDWYVNTYFEALPDGQNPLVHYLEAGWKQGAEPYKGFSTREYYIKYPEATNQVPLYHHIERMRNFEALGKSYQAAQDPNCYIAWLHQVEPKLQVMFIRPSESIQQNRPLISLVTATYKTYPRYLRQLYDSIRAQNYSQWEWCVADGGSDELTIKELKAIASKDDRVHLRLLPENKGIAGNTNEAIDMTSGDLVAFVDHDDTLSPFALETYAALFSEYADLDIIYSDEDKLSEDGSLRSEPFFKPDWSPDLLRSINYMTHFLAIRKELLDSLGRVRSGFDGSQDYDLILRATERARRICHIPQVLYHWRRSPSSTAAVEDQKTYALDAGANALREHLERQKINGELEVHRDGLRWWYDVRWFIQGQPLITVVIPNKDHYEDLSRCIESLLRSTYKNLEVIIVENSSTDIHVLNYYDELQKIDQRFKVITWEKSFNYSAINNFAVQQARGDFILLLNNDIEAINNDWLERMLGLCQRDDVGAVGALLLYPNNTVQHAGVIVGLGGVAGHSHKHYPADHPGYFNRLRMTSNYSAVTAACMLVKTSLYRNVGGFDSERFPVAFNDVDFCLRIRKLNKLIVCTPRAKLYHHESKSRGSEDTLEKQTRFKSEIQAFKEKWGSFLKDGDPYYSTHLVTDAENFAIKTDISCYNQLKNI